jgi:predicted Na+-dependent transporter
MSGPMELAHQIEPGYPTSRVDRRSKRLKPCASAGLLLIRLVIASEAKQSSTQQSLDCVVASGCAQ